MREIDILVVGEVNADLILTGDASPVFGQVEKVVDDATLTIGGSGTIFACGAARLGLQVAYSGVVGDDLFGRYLLESLRQRGVDTSGIHVDPALKTGLSVILCHDNDRAILTHLGAIDRLRVDQVNPHLLACARHVHVTSYFLQRRLQPGLPDLLARARRNGATISIDTNWDPAEDWNHGLHRVLELADVFLPNRQEALSIARTSDLPAALDTLAAITPTVAVKLGAAGAMGRRGAATVSDPGFHMDVVDATGAGDSFNAGFLYGYLQGWELDSCLAIACACGSLSTRVAGGTVAQPTLEEAQNLVLQRG